MNIYNRQAGQRGFSMIEVLVSVLIVSIGILGTLSLLINGLRMSSSSNYRSIAAAQATAMAEVLRGNPRAIISPAGSGLSSFDVPVPGSNPDCYGVGGCARSDFVNNNVWDWQQQLANSLPSGTGIICRDGSAAASTTLACTNTGQYVVKVCWNEQRIQASSSALNVNGALCTWTAI